MPRDLKRFDTLFEDYLAKIALTQTQANLIDRALNEAASLFMSSFDNAEIYAQGSYATGTVVKPLTEYQDKSGVAGEYDVDIVIERESWAGPKDALENIKESLSMLYVDKVDQKKHESCERVYYHDDAQTGVSFHVDYVPILAKSSNTYRYVAKRSTNSWSSSDTKKLRDWFLSYIADKPFVQPTIVMLKRIRDYAGLTDCFPSICIMALVCEFYVDTQSYAGDLMLVIKKIVEVLSKPYEQISIQLPGTENLVGKIGRINYDKIKAMFQACLSALENELIRSDTPDMTEIREYLSDDFPVDLASYPECLESLRGRGFSIEMDGSLTKEEIIEEEKRGVSVSKVKYRFREKGKSLKFVATHYDKAEYGIRWQVLNSADTHDRRGGLFEARGRGGKKNSDEFINYETVKYDGIHWIRYFIYDKGTKRVVGISEKFYIEVKK